MDGILSFLLVFSGHCVCCLASIIISYKYGGYEMQTARVWGMAGLVFGIFGLIAALIVSLTRAKNKNNTESVPTEKTNNQQKTVSLADELRQYKALLDEGVITEEEFLKLKTDLLDNKR